MAAQAEQYHHPLPSPPQQQQPQAPRAPQHKQQAPAGFQYYQQNNPQYDRPGTAPRTFSVQSAKSHKSHKSQTSVGSKKDFHETHEEKEARRLHSTADPTFAMNEAEPSAIAAMKHESSVQPLRSLQHRDLQGNPIADPDRSNPTRNRWERPLDTIRSFEAAIDGGYSRQSLYRSETDSAATWNRRTSMASTAMQPRFPQDSHYSNSSRPVSFRGDASHYGLSGPPTARNSGFFDGYGAGGHNSGYGPAPVRQIPRQRMHLEQQYQTYGREQGVYPMPHKDRSYETVTSAAGSGNSDPVGYQTDPTSSDNSSIRRASPAKRQEPMNDYGIGFSQGQSQAYQQNFTLQQPQQTRSHPLPPPPANVYQEQPPAVPRKGLLRRQSSRAQTPQAQPVSAEKRKSWFSRRFSKGD